MVSFVYHFIFVSEWPGIGCIGLCWFDPNSFKEQTQRGTRTRAMKLGLNRFCLEGCLGESGRCPMAMGAGEGEGRG